MASRLVGQSRQMTSAQETEDLGSYVESSAHWLALYGLWPYIQYRSVDL